MPAVPRHRQPIINAALTLFRRQGFSRTGLNDIVDVSGAPKGSLYHYFPLGKSSIAVAAVEEAGRRAVATLEKLASECGSTSELLRAHARLLAGWMLKSGFRDGCPITTVLLELAPRERTVTDAGRRAYAARLSILSRKLVEDGFPQVRATVGSTSRLENLNEFLTAAQNVQPLPAEIQNEIVQLQYRWSDELDMRAEPWTM